MEQLIQNNQRRIVCVCVSVVFFLFTLVCWEETDAYAYRDQERESGPLKLELQVVVTH